MRFKRNQIEEAISHVLEPSSSKPGPELRSRLKRLLDTDRALDRNTRSSDPERANFAFYGMDAPGRGVEIWFSDYEAFAALVGLRLMQHGWPQGFVVEVLRRVRAELEGHHDRFKTLDWNSLFDKKLIRLRARPGDLVVDNTDPVFLAIMSGGPTVPANRVSFALCRGQPELVEVIRTHAGGTWSAFELVNWMYKLAIELAKTKPSKRGRGNE